MPYRPGAGPQKDSDLISVEDVYRSDNVFVNNVPVALHEPPYTVEGGVNIPTDTYVYDQFHADPIIQEAGINAPFDDVNAVAGGNFDASSRYPNVSLELPDEVPGAQERIPARRNPTGISVDCKSFQLSPLDYNEQLSPNYVIGDFSIYQHFPHKIRPQNGLTLTDILCNLQSLAVNIVEPLRAKYPGFRINSGFRSADSGQHGRGQAVDVQWPGKPPKDYNEIAVWCIANLPFDQFIFEHGLSIWIHMSYNRLGGRTGPNSILTYYPKKSPNYVSGLINYYAPSEPFPTEVV